MKRSDMGEEQVVQAVVAAIRKLGGEKGVQYQLLRGKMVPVGVSARHIHLTPEHIGILFGPGYKLKWKKTLMGGQFACEETVTLVGPRGVLSRVRVLGPPRPQSQVEISTTDCYALGVEPVLRVSGDVQGTPGLAVVGTEGAIFLKEGVIVAWRHVHMTPADADFFGVRDGQMVKARVGGQRGLVLEQILVRVSEKADLELHIDTDEGNAAGLESGARVELLC